MRRPILRFYILQMFLTCSRSLNVNRKKNDLMKIDLWPNSNRINFLPNQLLIDHKNVNLYFWLWAFLTILSWLKTDLLQSRFYHVQHSIFYMRNIGAIFTLHRVFFHSFLIFWTYFNTDLYLYTYFKDFLEGLSLKSVYDFIKFISYQILRNRYKSCSIFYMNGHSLCIQKSIKKTLWTVNITFYNFIQHQNLKNKKTSKIMFFYKVQ